MPRFDVFISEEVLGAGFERVSTSDHQAAVEALASRVENGTFQWGSVRDVSNSSDSGSGRYTFVAPKPK